MVNVGSEQTGIVAGLQKERQIHKAAKQDVTIIILSMMGTIAESNTKQFCNEAASKYSISLLLHSAIAPKQCLQQTSIS